MKTSTYIKQMALRGRIINIDLQNCHEYITALNKIGSNVNQIARCVNATGYITDDEIRQIQNMTEEVCRISSAYLSKVQSQAA